MSIIPSFLQQKKLDDNDGYDYYSNNKIELTNGDGRSIILLFDNDDDDGNDGVSSPSTVGSNVNSNATSNINAKMQGKWHKVLKDVLLELIFKDAFVYGQDNRISIKGVEDVIHRAKQIVHAKHCHLTRARFIRDNKIKVQTLLIKLLDDPNGSLLVSKEEAEELLKVCSVDFLLTNDSDLLALKAVVPYLLSSQEIVSSSNKLNTATAYESRNGTENGDDHENIHHRAITLALSPSSTSAKSEFTSSAKRSYNYSPVRNSSLTPQRTPRSPYSVLSDNSSVYSQASSTASCQFTSEKNDLFSSVETWIAKKSADVLQPASAPNSPVNGSNNSITKVESNISVEESKKIVSTPLRDSEVKKSDVDDSSNNSSVTSISTPTRDSDDKNKISGEDSSNTTSSSTNGKKSYNNKSSSSSSSSNGSISSSVLHRIGETSEKGRRLEGSPTRSSSEYRDIMSPNSKPILKPVNSKSESRKGALDRTKSDEISVLSTESTIGSNAVEKRATIVTFKNFSYLLVFIALFVTCVLYSYVNAPVVTIIQVDSDVVFVRIDRSRASVPKHIPLEYYSELKKSNLLPAPNAHSTSQHTATEIVSVSSSSSTNSVKVISQMKARIKKLFKPFVDIVNFFGGMFTFKKN